MKLNIDEAFVDVKSNVEYEENIVGFCVTKLGDNQVDITRYFSTKEELKARGHMISWFCSQATKTGFTLTVENSYHDI